MANATWVEICSGEPGPHTMTVPKAFLSDHLPNHRVCTLNAAFAHFEVSCGHFICPSQPASME